MDQSAADTNDARECHASRDRSLNRKTPVQFAQRTQNSIPTKSRLRRNPSLAAINADIGDIDTAPKSTARLEAEAAFAAPQLNPTPNSQAQITVRRARIALLPKPVAEDNRDAQASPASKSPRVFRVEAAHAVDPELHARSPQPVSAASDDAAKPSPNTPTKRPLRRHVADKRPGPVVHLVQALPLRPQHEANPAQPAALACALAELDRVLQAIERAQSWVFIEDRIGNNWQALSERISAVRAQLHAPRPWRE